ncbi:MAG TPA: hypothetical protein VHE78_04070 [Gemmatimonadaceae bacterium]|nr:hypothetical protein [Gemmatimonadaceae bacterium]
MAGLTVSKGRRRRGHGDERSRLRRAPLDHGLAAEIVDEEEAALANGGDAALSGLPTLSGLRFTRTVFGPER